MNGLVRTVARTKGRAIASTIVSSGISLIKHGLAGMAAILLLGCTTLVLSPGSSSARGVSTALSQNVAQPAPTTIASSALIASASVAPGNETNSTLPSGGFVIAGSLNPTPATGTAHIRLIEQSPIIHNSGKFTTDLELVRGANNEPLEASFTIHQAVTNRAAFRNTALGNDLGTVLAASSVVVVPPVPAGSTKPVFSLPLTINVTTTSPASSIAPTDGAQVTLPGPGTYPVRVTLRATQPAAQATPAAVTPTPIPTPAISATTGTPIIDGFTTYLTVVQDPTNTPPAQDERLKVALVVPIHLQPSTQPNGSITDPNTAQVIALTEALVRRPIPPLTISVTPEALKTLARQGADENPDRRSQVLDQLRSALNGREIIGGPFVEPSAELLDDPNLSAERIRQRIEGERTVRETLAAPLPGLVVLENHIPNAASLGELGATSVITSTKALGLLDRTSKEFNEQSIAVATNRATATQPVTIHLTKAANSPVIKGVLADVALAQRCTETFGDRQPKDDNTLRAQQFLAELGFLRAEVPANQRLQRGITVTIPPSTTSATLDAILGGIGADDGMFHAVPVSTILALPISKTLAFQRKETTPSVLSSEQREELQAVHTKLAGYNALFAKPRAEAVVAESGLRSVLAAERTTEDRAALLRSLRSQANDMLGALALVQSKSLTLTAREQTVKIGVLNNSGQPSNVTVDLQSDNVEFVGAQIDPDQPRRSHLAVSVNLAGRVQQIPVQVRTRGPGSFSFVAQLRSAPVDGAPEGVAISSRRYTVRSTAVGKLGTIISVGALIFLGIWWLRSILRRRRAQTKDSQNRHPSHLASSIPVASVPGAPSSQQPPEVP
jgi:hypothetical protein